MDPTEIKSQFQTSFYRQMGMAALLVPVLIYGKVTEGHGVIPGWAFLLMVLGALGFSFWNWRCPSCSAYLGRGGYPKHCGGCGVELR